MTAPDEPNPNEGAEPSEEEFDREWAELKRRFPALDPDRPLKDDDDDDADPRDPEREAEALEAFIRRHPTRLRRRGVTLEDFLTRMIPLKDEFVRAQGEEEKAHDELLHSKANLAEAERNLILAIFDRAQELEAMTEEQWQAIEPKERTELWNFLGEFRGRREEWLANLPVEDRRRLEAGEG
jgi:hypothetical protein